MTIVVGGIGENGNKPYVTPAAGGFNGGGTGGPGAGGSSYSSTTVLSSGTQDTQGNGLLAISYESVQVPTRQQAIII